MPSPFPSTMERKTKEVGAGGGDCLPWGTPLYGLYRYVQPERVWVISHFGHKQGIYFVQFSLKKGLIFAPSLKLCIPLRRSRSSFSNHYQFNKFMAVFQASVFSMVCKFLAPWINLFLYLLQSSKLRSFLLVWNLLHSMFYCSVFSS